MTTNELFRKYLAKEIVNYMGNYESKLALMRDIIKYGFDKWCCYVTPEDDVLKGEGGSRGDYGISCKTLTFRSKQGMNGKVCYYCNVFACYDCSNRNNWAKEHSFRDVCDLCIRKSQINVVAIEDGRYKTLEHNFVLEINEDNSMTAIGVKENENIRYLTYQETLIAREMGLKVNYEQVVNLPPINF